MLYKASEVARERIWTEVIEFGRPLIGDAMTEVSFRWL